MIKYTDNKKVNIGIKKIYHDPFKNTFFEIQGRPPFDARCTDAWQQNETQVGKFATQYLHGL